MTTAAKSPRKANMNPNQLNTFWKTCIQKEEAIYGDPNKEKFNILTHAVTNVRAAQDHLKGTGAIMATPDTEKRAAANLRDLDVGSIASMKSAAKSTAGSQAGSKVSKAGSSAEIMSRLAALERELKAERERRHIAESQMLQLMEKTAE